MAKGRLNMAEGFPTLDRDITGFFEGESPKFEGMNEFRFKNNLTGQETTTNLPYSRETVIDLFDKENLSEQGEAFKGSMRPVFDRLMTKDKRGFLDRVVWPNIMALPANIRGMLPDMATLATFIPAEVTEFGAFLPEVKKAIKGEGTWEDVQADIEKSKATTRKKVGQYGTEASRREFEAWARRANKYAEENWGWSPFVIGTDMTPEAYGWFEKTISLGMEFGLSGPLAAKAAVGAPKLVQEGIRGGARLLAGARKFFPQLAKESVEELGEAATSPENVQNLIDRANNFYRFGGKQLYAEGAAGVVSAVASQTGLSILEEADPEAAEWLKGVVGVTGAFTGPVMARSLLTGLVSLPGVQKVVREGFIDPLFRPFTSAARFERAEALGGDKTRLIRVHDVLAEALEKGRHVDQASGLAFTTPELARSEANFLRAKYKNIRDRLDSLSPSARERNPEQVQRIERLLEKTQGEIRDLTEYGNFQEAVLHSATKDKGSAQRFFAAESERLVERREHFFNYIENKFKTKIDDMFFGGDTGGTPVQHEFDYQDARTGKIPVYEETRRRLVMEGDPKGIEASELRFLSPEMETDVKQVYRDRDANMQRVLEDSRDAAAGRIEMWRDALDRYLAERGLRSVDDLPPEERKYAGQLIRDTYEDAYREYRAFETAAYNRVRGLTDKVEEDIRFPDDAIDVETGESIGGMTPAEFGAMKFETLSRSQKFNLKEIPVQIAQLVGMRSVIAQLNRRQKEARAAGKASAAEENIPVLEKRRDDAIAEKDRLEIEYNKQLEKDRTKVEDNEQLLEEYYRNKIGSLDDTQKRAVDEFITRPDDIWETMNQSTARGLAPPGLGLESIFGDIARLKKIIVELGDETSSRAVRDIDNKMRLASKAARQAQDDINAIASKFLGVGDDVNIQPTGRLASLDEAGDLIEGGTSAEDVRKLISEIGVAIRQEESGTLKHAQLVTLRSTMEQLLDKEVFPTLDTDRLKFAREVSEVEKRIEGAAGEVLGKERGTSEVTLEVETLPEQVLPASPELRVGEVALRKLETAVAEVPPFVSIVRSTDADGNVTTSAFIDEDRVTAGQSLFDRPDVPFERVTWGQDAKRGEIRLKEGVEPTPRSLDLAENILLERLALKLEGGVDSAKLDSFRSEHKAIIDFLKKNGRETVPGWLANTEDAAAHASVLNTLLADTTKRHLTELVKSGQIDLQNMTMDDYLGYIKDMRQRAVRSEAVETVFNAEPGQAVEALFRRVLSRDNTTPKTDVQEVLVAVRNNKAAEEGFKAAFIGNLFKKATVDPDALRRIEGDIQASAFDPVEFRNLMKDDRIRMMITQIFPDNPHLLDGLTELSLAAFEPGLFTKRSVAGAGEIDIQDALSMEAWSNLGRILGLGVAKGIGFINALVAAGAGSRYLRSVGKKVTGNVIKDIVVEAALNPRRALELTKKSATQIDTFREALARGIIDSLNVPGAVLQGIRRRPGAASEIITEPVEELDEDTDRFKQIKPYVPPPEWPILRGDQSSARPTQPPSRRVASAPVGSPIGASILSQTNVLAPQTSAQTKQRGQDVFGALDPVFANKGGIVSIPRKPRQLVG